MSNKNEKFFSRPQLEEAARLFGILADASRLAILSVLMSGESTVGGIVAATGLNQANVSRHLSVLHGGGFVARRKQANFVLYSVCDPAVKDLCSLMCGRMAREAGRLARALAGAPG